MSSPNKDAADEKPVDKQPADKKPTPEQIVKELESASQSQQWEQYQNLLDDDIEAESPSYGRIKGKEPYMARLRDSPTIDDTELVYHAILPSTEGDMVATHWTWYMPGRESNTRIITKGMSLLRFNDQMKVTRIHHYFDPTV